MSRREAVLALDQGSSSSRVIAFGLDGRVLASAQRPVRTFRPAEGLHEHDPLELAKSLESALDSVLAALPKSVDIRAAGLACQRSTFAFFDPKTLKPRGRAPSWMDGRASGVIAPLMTRQADAHVRTGLYITPYYSAPKIRFCLDADKSLSGLMAAPVSTFLIARLTQGAVLAVDPTMAQRMLLLNVESLDWDAEMMSMFGIDRGILPEIRPTTGDWGVIERKGRSIPILACVGDQQAAAAGLGADAKGSAVANYGTGAFLLAHAGDKPPRIPGLLATVAWKKKGSAPEFFSEGTVHAAGTSFEWLRGLGLMKDPRAIDAAFKRSKARVLCLPAIGGLGAPRWDYVTKTAWFGLTSKTTPDDLVRGTAEGLCFLLSDIAAAMRAGGVSFSSVRAAGGLARADSMLAFQADLLEVPIERAAQTEATALGAALLAAEAAGMARLGASQVSSGRSEQTFSPRLEHAKAAKLRADWTRFVAAQADLSRAVSLS